MNKTMTDSERFWSKYIPEPNSGCWLWMGTLSNNGYGVDCFGSMKDGTRRYSTTNRLACELSHGPAPSKEHQALHKCDVKLCINPSHLYWGTRKDNGRDAKERGKTGGISRPGSANPRARLTESQAIEVLKSKEPAKVFVEKYGITRTQVSYIRNGKSWGYLNGNH